jgi:hypothetical protein
MISLHLQIHCDVGNLSREGRAALQNALLMSAKKFSNGPSQVCIHSPAIYEEVNQLSFRSCRRGSSVTCLRMFVSMITSMLCMYVHCDVHVPSS